MTTVAVSIRVDSPEGHKLVEVAGRSTSARALLLDRVTEALASVLGVPVTITLPPEPAAKLPKSRVPKESRS